MPTDPTDPTTPSTPTTPNVDLGALTDEATRAQASINGAHDSISKLNTVIDVLTIGLGGSTKAFETFAKNTDTIQTFNKQLDGLGKYSSVAEDVMRKLTFSVTGNNAAFSASSEIINKFVRNIADGADNALKLEQGYLQIAGATGQMNKVFEQAGPSLQNINSVLQDQGIQMTQIATATNTSLGQVSQIYKEMGTEIPGSVNKQIEVTGLATKSINEQEAAMKLMAGTSGDMGQVMEALKTAWKDYGIEGEKALEFTSRMSDLSEKFGINLSYTQKFMEENANAFKLFGSQGEDVDETFNRMFQSMRNTGLSASASSDLIGRMTGSLASLTTAQKAFLSAQSGGPGGLRGAAQIDELLKAGKSDEVMRMVEDNLKKHFGGTIVTQAEAAQSEAAAAAFNKQKLMLQSSAFGKLAGNDQEAARILEMMKAGTTAAPMQTAESALAQHIQRGTDVQKQSNSILNDQLRELQKQTMLAEINSLDKLQKYMGNTERTDRGPVGSIDRTIEKMLDDKQQKASDMAAELTRRNAAKTGTEYSEGIRNTEAMGAKQDFVKDILDKFGGIIPASFQKQFAQISDNMSSPFKKEGKEGENLYNKAVNDLAAEKAAIDKRNMGRAPTTMPAADQNELRRVIAEQSALQSLGDQYKKAMSIVGPSAPIAQPVDRVARSAQMVDNAVTTNKSVADRQAYRAPAAPNVGPLAAPQQLDKMQLDIKVRGIVCDKCGTKVMQNPNMQQITTNTGTHQG